MDVARLSDLLFLVLMLGVGLGTVATYVVLERHPEPDVRDDGRPLGLLAGTLELGAEPKDSASYPPM